MKIKPTFVFTRVLTCALVFGAGWVRAQTMEELSSESMAFMKTWTPAVAPEGVLQKGQNAEVYVRFVVDEKGAVQSVRVVNSPDPRLDEAAIKSVNAWTFSPAKKNGEPVASSLDLVVEISATPKKLEKGRLNLPRMPQTTKTTPAAPKTTPPGDYPAVLSERKLAGIVNFSCRIDTAGRVKAPRILGFSHADFVLPALAALAKWEFTPAKQGDIAVETELVGEVSFDAIAGNRAEVLAANGITAPDGSAPSAWPQPVVVADAVWPHDLLMQGGGGEAVVEFSVGITGAVTDLKVRSATQPAFGQAALGALERWLFRPALSDGQAVVVPLVKRVEFVAVPQTAPAEAIKDPEADLVRAMRAGSIGAPKGLDEKLTPIFRVPPVYPAALKAAGGPKGEAMIEFVIARDGRARLPRIVSASHEEFGWAAATAVAQWVFKAPLRGGEAVDVKVSIPMSFSAPES